MHKNKTNISKALIYTLLLALVLRIVFILFGADVYFSRDNFMIDRDTWSWATMFVNLVETGEYTINPGHEYGYFGRMPGYSFFMGAFWLLTGKDWSTAFPIIAWLQIFLDVVTVYLLYHFVLSFFKSKQAALVSAVLYACYPFIIVWTPVVYSECLSVFLMILSLYLAAKNKNFWYLLFSGAALGAAILCRPQIFLLVPVYIFVLWKPKQIKTVLVRGAIFFAGFIMLYGPWPIRNYINHNKIILTQDLRGFGCWNEDVLAFLQYVYSVKSGWQPQRDQIVKNKPVTWPDIAYTSVEDSLKLEQAVWNAKYCSRGFSHQEGYWKASIDSAGCTKETAQLFNELRQKQIETNPLNFYVVVPLQNLKKAVFKSDLVKPKNKKMLVLGKLLFAYRTLLIFLGFAGAAIAIWRKQWQYWVPLLFALFVYVALCFGTAPQFRNIEMRYFLHADIMLLIPAAWFISQVYNQFKKRLCSIG